MEKIATCKMNVEEDFNKLMNMYGKACKSIGRAEGFAFGCGLSLICSIVSRYIFG